MKFCLRFYLPLAALIVFSCNSNSSVSTKNEKGTDTTRKATAETTYSYDLAKPAKKWTLPNDLLEISGITWIDNNHLLVIEDLHPNLYLLRLDNDAQIEKTIPFHETSKEKFDIEDVTVANNVAYALYSHGKIFKIQNWKDKPDVKEIKTWLSKENNTEGICYDPESTSLLVACKQTSGIDDEKKSTRAVFQFDLSADSLKQAPFLLIEKKDIKKTADEKLDFYPSAIAVHPKTHDIYILSTKGSKVMVQYSHSGQIKSVQEMDAGLLPQPEGICFSPDGTMYISTEGKHGVPAAIYRYNVK
jgi:uncharacterized protein YjiK